MPDDVLSSTSSKPSPPETCRTSLVVTVSRSEPEPPTTNSTPDTRASLDIPTRDKVSVPAPPSIVPPKDASTSKTSSPLPPAKTSWPPPPTIVSSPDPPERVSETEEPINRSEKSEPTTPSIELRLSTKPEPSTNVPNDKSTSTPEVEVEKSTVS